MSCKGRLNLQDKTSVYLVWNKITPSCFMQRKSDHPWPDKPPSLYCRPYLTSEGKHVARHLNSSCYRNSLDFWYLMCGVDQDLKFYLLVYFYLFYPNFEKDQTTDADKLIIHDMLIPNPFSLKTVNNCRGTTSTRGRRLGCTTILTISFTTPPITSCANNFRRTEYLRNTDNWWNPHGGSKPWSCLN